MKKIFFTVLFFSVFNLFSQCLTDHYHQEQIKNNPQIAIDEQQFYTHLKPVNDLKRGTLYIVPVVFHVIHVNGPENITKAQIDDQIKLLNLDFSLNNPNKSAIRSQFKNLAADCQIEFRLAKIDPNGNCTDGINRVFSPLTYEARDNVKSIIRWDNKKYFNIWVVSSIESSSGLPSGGIVLGFSCFPQTVAAGASNLDGVVIRADYVGSIGTAALNDNAGRTLTHEIGHSMGLYHTFTDECAGTGKNAGDYCDDTPPVLSAFTNANCPANKNSCNSDIPDVIDQWENYMDYSSGTCQSMFSLQQKTIMHNVINGYSFRINLVSSANLKATGVVTSSNAPSAFFSSSKRVVCVGEPVTFFDNSCKGIVDSRQWQFTGANTFSTNLESPTITYSAPGKYKVTLIATNSLGSNTLAVNEYIEVKPSVAIKKPEMLQGFEYDDWLTNSEWKILDPGKIKFKVNKTVGYSGTKCLQASCDSTLDKQPFQLTTPSIDLRPLKGKSPKLSMLVAYARVDVNSSERLKFYASSGCGGSWEQIYLRNAVQFAYSSTTFTTDFKPSDKSQWKLVSFSLAGYENDSNIQFMIEIESGMGNPVYIDDINISRYYSEISNIEKAINLNVFPNPANDKLTINYENNSGETEVWLENIEGKKIDQLSENNSQSGAITIEWSNNMSISSGLYILKIKANNQVISKKIIFAN